MKNLTPQELQTVIIALQCQKETLLTEAEKDADSREHDKRFAARLTTIIAKLKAR